MATLRLEKALFRDGSRRIAGVDEVGRGSLFGSVVAAAVILPPEWLLRRLPAWARAIDDSKLLSAPVRAGLAASILREASTDHI